MTSARAPGPDDVPEELGLFRIARTQDAGGGDWYANPSSLPNLLTEIRRRTGIAASDTDVPVTLDDERLYSYPMLYVTGHGTLRPSPGDLERLRRYLDAGGFLWVDDNYGLDSSFRQMIAERSLYSFLIDGNRYIPDFQFGPGNQLVPNIGRVNRALDPSLHPVAVYNWYHLPEVDLFLGEDIERIMSPLDWLKSGQDVERVVALAATL